MKVRVIKFAGEHRKLGRLYVGREIDVDEQFFKVNKSFFELIDDSVGTPDIGQEDDSGADTDTDTDTEPLNDNDETISNPSED